MLPGLDFETYSEAGYFYDAEARRWRSITPSPPHGLGAVGAPAYAEHPSTEILSLAYDLRDNIGPRLWVPGCPPPDDLFGYIAAGGLLQAWNASFEFYIWHYVAHCRLGWPALPLRQLRCTMARGKHFGLPGKLAKAGEVIDADALKIDDGTRLLNKFSRPRSPTKNDDRLRLDPATDTVDGPKLYAYNLGDIAAEDAIATRIPALTDAELEVWRLDQQVNVRGVAIDRDGLEACKDIITQAERRYTAELAELTNGAVRSAGELQKMQGWLAAHGVALPNMQAETIRQALAAGDLPGPAHRVLELRELLASASVKKIAAIDRRLNSDGRLRDLFRYYGAERTGRWAGAGVQPQNLTSSGPPVRRCAKPHGCGRHYRADADRCPWCGLPERYSEPAQWSVDAAEDALQAIATRDLGTVERTVGGALDAVGGCLRGLFVAGPGCDLICSDYVAIEAVVVACLAGEQWRIELFRDRQPLYEMSASKITGVPLQDYLDHKAATGQDHPHRKKIGKVAELASPYGGGVGAWKAFGADEYFDSDDAIQDAVRAWRRASPMIAGNRQAGITGLWYGLENAAKDAIRDPGTWFEYRALAYYSDGRVLYCRLPSGRLLHYHAPRLVGDYTPWGEPTVKILYDGWNSDSLRGPIGWVTFDTWGGKLTENACQAVARDILAHGLLNVDRAGYPPVLHVHDEGVAEVPAGFGSVYEYERILEIMPPWAQGWPIRAGGGWRGRRYRKD